MKVYKLTEAEVAQLTTDTKEKKQKKVKVKKKIEFSKLFVGFVSLMWIAAAFFCAYYVYIGYVEFMDTLLTFVGGPMLGGIIMYMAKSAFENKEKIKTSVTYEHDEITTAITSESEGPARHSPEE